MCSSCTDRRARESPPLSGAIADLLRESGLVNAVIDLDDLTMVCPHPERSFALNNLRAIWPNYATIAGSRLVIASGTDGTPMIGPCAVIAD